MRISHKKRKPEINEKKYFFNEKIIAPEVRVLDNENNNLGVMKTGEAIRAAQEQEMDLVEINPKANPPVCKIMDFGQFQYQQEKAARIKKAHQKETKTKGVRLSIRIGTHDLEIRKKQTLEFLDNGDKVKVEVILKGREMQQGALAFELLKKFISEVNVQTPIKYDQEPERQGRSVTAIIFKI
ncbi:MAG TPA: translation initiation factor IF-3 [Candidatus Magasanikbacteria bacterium]|mgnify:CR=1|nr:translation initiation factor IF-3 [Candidatus Magasanikbacteria bacterium]